MEESIVSIASFLNTHQLLLLIVAILWTLPWKGVALWKAGRLSHKWWFIALLMVNTFGILEILYIFLVAKKYTVVSETEEL